MISSSQDAYQLLEALGAPQRLVKHAFLVMEAGESLLAECARLGVLVDATFVKIGIVIHDVGKIEFPEELAASGSMHTKAGERLLLEHGVAPQIARCCVSHAYWASMACSLEELLIALADKLWKGKREPLLETFVIDEVAQHLGLARWDVYMELDSEFELVAADGHERLIRSTLF